MLLSSFSATAQTVVATYTTPSGELAQLVVDSAPILGPDTVDFRKVRIEIDGEVYRVANRSFAIAFSHICEPYTSIYPYTYIMLETRKPGILGFGGEKVVEILGNEVIESYEDVVVTQAFCQKEMY